MQLLDNLPYQHNKYHLLNIQESRNSQPKSRCTQENDDFNKNKINNEKFCISIKSFVLFAESQVGSSFSFTNISKTYNITQRRLYDIVNVLEAIGCCKKIAIKTIFWNGLSFVPEQIKCIFSLLNLEDPEVNINTLIPEKDSILIFQLTQSFILLFIALQKQELNIKAVARFLSCKNNRFKTTLCKLHQISYIFFCLGICKKSSKPGLIILNKPYYFEYKIQENSDISSSPLVDELCYTCSQNQNDEKNPLSIVNLLNRRDDSNSLKASFLHHKIISKRNEEFELFNN